MQAEASTILPIQPPKERDGHAKTARPFSNLAVQTSIEEAVPQVAPLPPLHRPTMKAHPDENTIQQMALFSVRASTLHLLSSS